MFVGLGGKGVLVGAGVEVGVDVAGALAVAVAAGVFPSDGPLIFSSCPQASARATTTSPASSNARRFMDVSSLP